MTAEKEIKQQQVALTAMLRAVDAKLDAEYGFHSPHFLVPALNARCHLGSMPMWYYFQRPSNLACHNLATKFKPPPTFRSLLGLGLSFCPRPFFTTNKALTKTMTCLCHDLYNQFAYGGGDDSDYDPQLYAWSNHSPPMHLVAKELIQ